MTDNVEKVPTVTKSAPQQAASKKASAPKAASKNEKAPSRAGFFIAVLALLLVLLSLTAVGGIVWKGYELSIQVAGLDQDLQQSEDARAMADKQLANVKQQLVEQASYSKQNSVRIAQLPGTEENDWLLAEVEYLLRLANQRMNLERDVDGSLAILKAADSVLAEAKNPVLLPVRQSVAKEIQTLKSIPAVDVVGAVARIQALQDQIKVLEWMPRSLPEVTAKVEPASEVKLDPFQKFLSKAWAGVGSIVRVREHDKALPAPLTPDQHYYLQQNMHLMLEQAQVALVRQQDDLYKQSLARTQSWLDEFVMTQSKNTAAVKNTLTELQAWNVSPKLPDISGSLNTLRKLVDQQRRDSVISIAPSVTK